MCALCAGFAYGLNRPRTLHTTAEMRVICGDWMRHLGNKHGELKYTYRQRQTDQEVRDEMALVFGCREAEKTADEEHKDDDDDDDGLL